VKLTESFNRYWKLSRTTSIRASNAVSRRPENRRVFLKLLGPRREQFEVGLPSWLDRTISAAGLIILSPLLAAIALVIKVSDGGPVLYRHARVGRRFRLFPLYKFRTMITGADRRGGALTGAQDSRITPIGRILRRYKLDELPQLFNVLRGEMALVGPRPEVPEFVERFRPKYGQLLRGRPGITDPASLAFSDEEALLTGPNLRDLYVTEILPRKLALSLEYFNRRSSRTDLIVLWRTFEQIVLRHAKAQ
jgi:lipopolysaccharide/colanic/teichoic acid biosynthesis glycosyltransferase